MPATQRWHDLAFVHARTEKQSSNRQARLAAILHTALYDAVVATWAVKYQFNRKPPSQMAPDVTPAVLITGAVSAPGTVTVPEPSYPSAHTALAGTAVGILTSFFPKEEANLKAVAADLLLAKAAWPIWSPMGRRRPEWPSWPRYCGRRTRRTASARR
jgi:membrane-associated phospholipid phosphatase